MSYTKKNLTVITLLLTILIFICLFLITSQISLTVTYPHNNSNKVYSKIIPIKEQNKHIQTIMKADNISESVINYTKLKESDTSKVSNLQQQMEQVQKEQEENLKGFTTKRQVIQANKQSAWRIQIPKLRLDVHIQEGTTANILLKAVGHFENTSKWNGNVCLASHNRGYLCNFFQNIKKLKIGDEIIYCTNQGKRIYKVETNKVILETDWRYIEETEDNRITLITCEENRGEYRRCVQAVQVTEELNMRY